MSREGLAMQRYEGQLDRSFRANLNQLIKLAQTGSDLIAAETFTESEPPIKPTDPEPSRPIKPTEAPTEPKSTNKPTEIDPTDEPASSLTGLINDDFLLQVSHC